MDIQYSSQSQGSQELETLQKENPSNYKHEVASEVTYSKMQHNHPPPTPPQRRQPPDTLENKLLSNCQHEDLPAPSSSWRILAVVLGIICLALLGSVGFLATRCKSQLDGKYPTCSNDWHQRGENCYFLSSTKALWEECDGFCTDLNSTFVKVDTKDELEFLMKLGKMQCDKNLKFFISLWYNSTQSKWLWLDGTEFTRDSFEILEHAVTGDQCTHMKYGHVIAEECRNDGHCACEKTIA